MGNCQINQRLLTVKLHYFIINSGMAGVMPFLTVYAMQLRVEAAVVGYVFAILCCLNFFSRPLIGGFVDYFQTLKTTLLILLFSTMIATISLSAIPQPQSKDLAKNFVCFESKDFSKNISVCTNSTCTDKCYSRCLNDRDGLNSYNFSTNSSLCYFIQKCTDSYTNFETRNCTETLNSDISGNNTWQIVLWSIFTALLYISYGSITSLSDSACFTILESKPYLYGKQRLWGTIGWGSFALLSGLINQIFTTASTYNFSPGFYMLIVFFLIDVFVVKKLDVKAIEIRKITFNKGCQFIIKPKVLIFIANIFFVGVFVGFSRSYKFWYLRLLKANQTLLGSISLTQCFLGELPFFFFSSWFISKIGHLNTFSVSFMAHSAKFILYSFIQNPYLGLPIELLQGPAFGSFYSAMTSYAKSVAEEGTEATAQGIASGAFEGLGVATGSLLGGLGIRFIGAKSTFFVFGIFAVVCSLISLVINNLKIFKK